MNVALLADIHANMPAFEAVLHDMNLYSIEAVIIAGDILGYYCDSEEVVKRIRTISVPLYIIAGNHDIYIIKNDIPSELDYSTILEQNLAQLSKESLSFIKTLKSKLAVSIDGLNFQIFHGTPDDPLNGRLYPDMQPDSDWNLSGIDFVILGHTHYPCIWFKLDNTIIINPGSVGQPRDGNPSPSWVLLNTKKMSISQRRIDYKRLNYAKKLETLNWDTRTIKALFKNKPGRLKENTVSM